MIFKRFSLYRKKLKFVIFVKKKCLKEPPPPPILRNLDNFPLGAFYLTPPTLYDSARKSNNLIQKV